MRQKPNSVSPMSNEGRNAYVTEHLTDALLALLRKKPLRDISVSELCDAAGVGRASFYRNFESKEAILRSRIDRLFSAWFQEESALAEGRPLRELIRSLFAHFESHIDFYRLLHERELSFLLKDEILALCGPKPEHSAVEAYSEAFVAYTLYGWVEVWFQRGMKESAEEMAALFQYV